MNNSVTKSGTTKLILSEALSYQARVPSYSASFNAAGVFQFQPRLSTPQAFVSYGAGFQRRRRLLVSAQGFQRRRRLLVSAQACCKPGTSSQWISNAEGVHYEQPAVCQRLQRLMFRLGNPQGCANLGLTLAKRLRR